MDQATGSPGTLNQRLYVQQDANYNVTSVTDTSGTVLERYIYSPYGQQTVLNPDGSVKGDGTPASSSYNLPNGYQGMLFDPVTSDNLTPNRVYDPMLATWTSEDPSGYVNGMDTYQLEGSRPLGVVDPQGLAFNPVRFVTNAVATIGSVGAQGLTGAGKLVGDGVEGLGKAAGNNPVGNVLQGAGTGIKVVGCVAAAPLDVAGHLPNTALNLIDDAASRPDKGVVAPKGTETVCPPNCVVVHIWGPTLLKGHTGHASMTLPDGTYISWWPDPSPRPDTGIGLNRSVNLDSFDKNGEGFAPTDYIIPGLKIAAIEAWWHNFADTHNRWIALGPNCATVVMDALRAGGAQNVPAAIQVWFPYDTKPTLNRLAESPAGARFGPPAAAQPSAHH